MLGIVLGTIFSLVFAGYVWFAIWLDSEISVSEARAGDCVDFEELDDSLSFLIRTRGCDELHDAEIVHAGKFDASLIADYGSVASGRFCVRLVGRANLAGLNDGRHLLGVLVDSNDVRYPSIGDSFACYLERADGQQLDHRLIDDGSVSSRIAPRPSHRQFANRHRQHNRS